MPVIVGATAPVSWAPAAGGAATLAVRLPDGTALAPAPTVTGAGPFAAQILTSQPGRHLVSWSRSADRWVDVLDVWPADPRFLISIDDALDACRIEKAPGRDAARSQMALYVAATTPVIEDMTGPLISEERTKVADGGRTPILLPAAPVQVVSVTVAGVLLAASAYDVDDDAGVVYGAFPPGRRNVAIAYRVGAAVLPQNLRLAVREEVRYLWQVGQQQPRQGTSGAPDVTVFTPSGFAVPRRVSELCAANPRPAGFA